MVVQNTVQKNQKQKNNLTYCFFYITISCIFYFMMRTSLYILLATFGLASCTCMKLEGKKYTKLSIDSKGDVLVNEQKRKFSAKEFIESDVDGMLITMKKGQKLNVTSEVSGNLISGSVSEKIEAERDLFFYVDKKGFAKGCPFAYYISKNGKKFKKFFFATKMTSGFEIENGKISGELELNTKCCKKNK